MDFLFSIIMTIKGNPFLQIVKNRLISHSQYQILHSFEYCLLEFESCLEFGIWSLDINKIGVWPFGKLRTGSDC